ncbi:MAG: polysaccharide deacetylase family protein [Alphaproteobacteria bacterium]|jgi:peptidoglycan/xylan/chitin deacetylase (PgdA/CDA1 family)|nr:polysaccharide deacetylase family protein [Alphaproteobacteria bacterium]MDP6563762.1 polysaccharide deacetylase family protein [Alphaproteobacteria bacterium]MDP6814104.1 polysaccharide deacetylase family protein [Alphaproteobacteria bacterium]
MSMTDQLAQEIEALEAAARATEARHEFIEDFAYPPGIRMAVNFTADFDAMLLRRLLNEPPMQLSAGEFGGRVGIWRLLELFNAHAIKATVFTPGRICELYPRAVAAVARDGHEVADHMWEHQVPKDRQLEADHLRRSTEALESTAGRRPVGSRSWHTSALLLEEGYIYNSHGCAHHRPYYLRDREGENRLLNLPFHYAIDDAMFFSFAWLASDNAAQRITEPERVMEMWWAAFQQQYRQGGYLNVVLHPFVSGRALRIEMLDRLINRMKALPGVWFPSCEEIARHCLENHPPRGAQG